MRAPGLDSALARLLGILPPPLRRWVTSNIILIGMGLPNLAVTLTTLTVLEVGFGWSGPWGVAAYIVAQVLSVQVAVVMNRRLRTRLEAFGKRYHFSGAGGDERENA